MKEIYTLQVVVMRRGSAEGANRSLKRPRAAFALVYRFLAVGPATTGSNAPRQTRKFSNNQLKLGTKSLGRNLVTARSGSCAAAGAQDARAPAQWPRSQPAPAQSRSAACTATRPRRCPRSRARTAAARPPPAHAPLLPLSAPRLCPAHRMPLDADTVSSLRSCRATCAVQHYGGGVGRNACTYICCICLPPTCAPLYQRRAHAPARRTATLRHEKLPSIGVSRHLQHSACLFTAPQQPPACECPPPASVTAAHVPCMTHCIVPAYARALVQHHAQPPARLWPSNLFHCHLSQKAKVYVRGIALACARFTSLHDAYMEHANYADAFPTLNKLSANSAATYKSATGLMHEPRLLPSICVDADIAEVRAGHGGSRPRRLPADQLLGGQPRPWAPRH